MNCMKRQKDRTLKDKLLRLVGAQYATGDQWRNTSRKNEEMESKQKQHPVVDVSGDGSKIWCCKKQSCIGTWNVRSINQGKLEVIQAEEPEIKLLTSIGSLKKKESSRKYIYFCLLIILKPLTVWITTNWKFFKRREYQTTWPASWETCIRSRNNS